MQNRNAQIDLLRVLAMLMIVSGHFVYHGVHHISVPDATSVQYVSSLAGRLNFIFLQFLGYSCNIATNIFFLITGYFLVRPRTLSYAVDKSYKQWKTIVFYSLSIYVVLCASGFSVFSLRHAIEQLTPIYSRNYWFMSTYIVLLLLSPFVSKSLDALSKKAYQGLLFVLLLINFAEGKFGYGSIFSGGMSLVFALSLFSLGGYIRKYPLRERRYFPLVCLSVYVGISLLLTFYSYFGQVLGLVDVGQPLHLKSMANNSIPLLCSVCFFLVFTPPNRLCLPAIVSRLSVSVSPYVLAVYLIHDNRLFRSVLWDNIVRPLDYLDSYWFMPYCLVTVILIFALCVTIEYIRQKIASLF